MAWCRPGDKPLSKPMLVNLRTHTCVTRSRWVNTALQYFDDDVMTWKCFQHYWPFVSKKNPVTGGFPSQGTNNAKLWCFFLVSLYKLLNNESRCCWSETPWRSCDVTVMSKCRVLSGTPQVEQITIFNRRCNGENFDRMNLIHICSFASTHCSDVIMGTMASQITNLTIVYSTVYSDAGPRKHQSSASLAFVRGIHRRSGNSPHKWPVTRKMCPFDYVIMQNIIHFLPFVCLCSLT